MKTSTELKVGIFVFVGILALVYLSFKLGGEAFTSEKTYPLYAVFRNVSGLSPGAKIEMAGVVIGRVGSISLTPEGRAKVVLYIYKKYKIPADSQALIKTYGILGDKYVEITPGTPGKWLPPGSYIAKTRGSISLQDVIAKVEPTIEGLNEIFGTPSGRKALKNFIKNMEVTSEVLKDIAIGLKEGKGTLGKLLVSEELYNALKQTFKNLEVVSKELVKGQKVLTNFIVKEKFFDHLTNIAKNLENITAGLRAGNGTLGKLLKSDKLYYQLQEVVLNIKDITDQLKSGKGTLGRLMYDEKLYKKVEQIADNLQEITKELREGKGTLGKLLKDDSLYVQAKKTLKSIDRAAQNVEDQVFLSVLGTVAGAAMK